jgi:putative DNA primase/helicase
MVGDDGKPVKSDADHQREYGENISPRDLEHVQVEYFILREVFEREVCRGFEPRAVARLLQSLGHLKGEGDRLMDRQRLPLMGGDKVPCYHILPSIFGADA